MRGNNNVDIPAHEQPAARGQGSREEWEELVLIYHRAERAAVKIQQTFRERNAKQDTKFVYNADDATTDTIVSDSNEEDSDVEDKMNEARGLDDGFWSRCGVACLNLFVEYIMAPFLTVLAFFGKLLSKGGDDSDAGAAIDLTHDIDLTREYMGNGSTP